MYFVSVSVLPGCALRSTCAHGDFKDGREHSEAQVLGTECGSSGIVVYDHHQ